MGGYTPEAFANGAQAFAAAQKFEHEMRRQSAAGSFQELMANHVDQSADQKWQDREAWEIQEDLKDAELKAWIDGLNLPKNDET
jgi:hypothetical protein